MCCSENNLISCIFVTLSALFIASLPAMGWTGKTFTDYRCWYIAVFPASLLIIVSVVVLSIIIVVCILYILILHSAVKTVDKIREYRETNSIAYVNKAFEKNCDAPTETSNTKVTITVSKETTTDTGIEMHELRKTNIEERQTGHRYRKVSKISTYYGQAKALNAHPSKLKAVKTVLIVICCFVGTWAPYYVTIIIYVNCDILRRGYACVPLEVLTLGPLYLLGVCNSLCDPLIYAWRHSGFKRTLRKMYLKYILSLKGDL